MTESVVGRLSESLAADAPVFSAWVNTNEPAVADALAREAFDAVILDMQHGAFDFAGASRAILAVALAGKPAIVRVPVGDFPLASRLLDAGAAGIIAPMVNSRADAERFAAFTKFPPLGERSWGPRDALPLSGLDGGAYLRSANALAVTIAMIETRAALAALDEILAVDGVDGVFIGPSDLSIALCDGARSDPRGSALVKAAGEVVARARDHRKFAGMFCFDGADAAAMAAMGFKLCSVSSDVSLLRAAARDELAAARGQASPGSREDVKSY